MLRKHFPVNLVVPSHLGAWCSLTLRYLLAKTSNTSDQSQPHVYYIYLLRGDTVKAKKVPVAIK